MPQKVDESTADGIVSSYQRIQITGSGVANLQDAAGQMFVNVFSVPVKIIVPLPPPEIPSSKLYETPLWQSREREVDVALQREEFSSFDTVDELLRDLRDDPRDEA